MQYPKSTHASDPTRVALVGCGAVSEVFYAPALIRLESAGIAEVSALVEPDPGRLDAMGQRFPGARRHARLEDLQDADLAIIATPPSVHCAQSLMLFDRGVHVLCEKPMAPTVRESRRMVAAAEQQGRLLAVGYVRRFQKCARTIRRVAERRTFGELRHVHVVEGHKGRWPNRSDALFRKGSQGALADIGSHVIDVLQWWCGAMSQAEVWDDAAGGVEANCWVNATFGVVPAEIFVSRWQNVRSTWVLTFERAIVRLDPGRPAVLQIEIPEAFAGEVAVEHVLGPDDGARPGTPHAAVSPETIELCFDAQIENIIACMRTGREPAVSGQEALRTAEAVDACYARRKPAAMPWLPEEERRALRRLS